MAHSKYFTGKLYQRMSEDLHLAGMAKRTHDGYLRAVRQLADFCQRSPDQISEDQLRTFFLHQKNDKQFASGSLRVTLSGLKFFYTRTCKRAWQTLGQMKIQNVKSLPEVLTIPQVHAIIDHCKTQRMAAYFWTVYGWMSSNSRFDIEKIRWLVWLWLGWTYWLGSGMVVPDKQKREALRCEHCGGDLQLLAIIGADGRVLVNHGLPYLDSG